MKNISYLSFWTAASAQTQNMLPALFSGLIYAIELLWITDLSVLWFQTQTDSMSKPSNINFPTKSH